MSQINLFSTSLSEAMLHSLWQGMFITLLLGLILKLLENASAHQRYLVITGAISLQLVLFVGTFSWVYQSGVVLPEVTDEFITVTPAQVLVDNIGATNTGLIALIDVISSSTLLFVRENHLLICLAWVLGTFMLSFRFAGGLVLLTKLRRAHNNAPHYLIDRLQELSETMKIQQKVKLVVSTDISVPSLIGWLKPVIILPVSMLTQMPPEQIDSILAHELAHVKRHDYLIHVLQSVIEIILFFNPFTWWLSNLMNDERENCCDDLAVKVIGDYKVYIQALASLTAQVTQTNIEVATGMLAATGKKGSVIFRINRIMKKVNKKQNQYRYMTRNFTGKLAAYCTILILSSLVLIGTGQAQEQDKKVSTAISVFKFSNDSLNGNYKVIGIPGDSTKVVWQGEGGNSEMLHLFVDSMELNEEIKATYEFLLNGESGAVATIFNIDTATNDSNKWSFNSVGGVGGGLHTIKLNGLKDVGEVMSIDSFQILKGPLVEEIQSVIHEYDFSKDTSNYKVIEFKRSDSTVTLNNKVSQQPLYIINGKKASHKQMQKLAPASIATVNVMKGDVALKQYGEEAINGVVKVELKDGKVNKNFEFLDSNDLLYFLNDKPITKADFEKIESELIERIDILKGETAVKRYGSKAAKGVINAYLIKKDLPMIKEINPPKEEKEITESEQFSNAVKIYPNPSSSLFYINFTLNNEAFVKITVNDISGKEIATITEQNIQSGVHQLQWEAKNLSKGMYFINIKKDKELFQHKVVLED